MFQAEGGAGPVLPESTPHSGTQTLWSSNPTDRSVLQEDTHFTHLSQQGRARVGDAEVTVAYSIVGVFDGHGGKRAADYSSKQVCWGAYVPLWPTFRAASSDSN